MEHARKMALVDTLRSPPPPPPPTDVVVLDRKYLYDRTNVTLYNQELQRRNVLSDKHVKEPVRLVAVNASMSAAASGDGAGGGDGGSSRSV